MADLDKLILDSSTGSSPDLAQVKAQLEVLKTAVTTYCVSGPVDPSYDRQLLLLFREVEITSQAVAAADKALADAVASGNPNLIRAASIAKTAAELTYIRASNRLRRFQGLPTVPETQRRGRWQVYAIQYVLGTRLPILPKSGVRLTVSGPGYYGQGTTGGWESAILPPMLADGDGEYTATASYGGTQVSQGIFIPDTSRDVIARVLITARGQIDSFKIY